MATGTSILDFLRMIITTQPNSPTEGWLRIFVRGDKDYWFQWPVLDLTLPYTTDVYFCPTLYGEPNAASQLLTSRTIALDISDTNLMYLPIMPSVLVRTSSNRRQGYWIFDTTVGPELATQLALSIEKVDPPSAQPGYLFRLPNTQSGKYAISHEVTVEQNTGNVYSLDVLIPEANGHKLYTQAEIQTTADFPPPDLQPFAYMRANAFSVEATQAYSRKTSDPKDTLAALITEAIRKDIPKSTILYLAKHSANNIFADLKYHQDEELLKYILDLETKARLPDPKLSIQTVRRVSNTVEERKDHVAQVVKDYMIQTGTFVHTKEGGTWYIPSHGPTVPITRRSEVLNNYLQNEFGINNTDIDTEHTIAVLCAFASKLPQRSYETKLSYYDHASRRLLLHTGINQVWNITPDTIELVPNGSYGVVLFPMRDIFLPVMPRPATNQEPQHWSEVLFGPFLDSILNLTREEARAVLSSWLLFLFFKNSVPSRPILALFGEPGSGKSTALKRICMFLYGKASGFSGITTAQDFDHATASLPLAIFDNVDTWEKWLPDRLAQSAATLETTVRRMYTNTDSVIIRRDALVAITAHDPKFSRADIADRLLILNMQRRTSFTKEQTLMQLPRSTLWYEMIADLQRILQTPMPDIPEQIRVEDFAAIGAWCSSALGLLPEFRSAIDKLRSKQRGFAVQGDQLLVDAIIAYIQKGRAIDEFKTASKLYQELEWAAGSNAQAFARKYRNATALVNRLRAAKDALSTICAVETREDSFKRELWRLTPKKE